MNQDKVGKLIERLRKQNNLTQKDLAEKLGVTYQAVSKWETGKNIPDISILKEISKMFDIDINDLLDGKETKRKDNKLIKIVVGTLILIVIVLIIILIINKNNGFEFNTISSLCSDYEVIGSAAYSKDKTTIYISNISYCGNDEKEYKEISCALYEKTEDVETKLSDCSKKGSNTNLKDYLKDIKINISKESNVCTNSNLYLRMNTTDDNDKIYHHDIELKLEDNCN